MAYNEHLADRIKLVLKDKHAVFFEKKMFGGVTFMVDNKMCIGVIKEDLMARIDPEFHLEAIQMTGCRTMDFTHRPMKGFVMIGPEGVDMDEDLDKWIQYALDYNPKAKSSKK